MATITCEYCNNMSVVTCFKCGKALCEEHLLFIEEPVVCPDCYEELKQEKTRMTWLKRILGIGIPVTIGLVLLFTLVL